MQYNNICSIDQEGTCYITINRPKQLNALNTDTISELNKAKVIFTQLIYKKKNLVAKLQVTVCCLNKKRKVARMNDQIYDILKKQERE